MKKQKKRNEKQENYEKKTMKKSPADKKKINYQ